MMSDRARDGRDSLSDSIILVKKAKAGDEEALNDLFRRYYPRVLQIVRLRLGPALRARLESQDIVQDAFARAVAGFDRFEMREESAFIHWLSEIVRNSIRDKHDYFQAKKRGSGKEAQPVDVDEREEVRHRTLPGGDATPSRIYQGKEDILRLAAALDGLDQEARDVIVFRDIEDLPFAEIGKMTGRSEDAARMLYSRAKAKLAERFEKS
jgi:RNA polymerase sigma-70 factor, ECF subfamily